MEFGKLEAYDNINFDLTETPKFSLNILNNFSKQDKYLYIGGTGWAMTEWIGKWYPKGTKSKTFLKEYANQFSTIECNTTFYRMPDYELISNWKSKVPQDFKFCIKLFNGISRFSDFGESELLFDHFNQYVEGLSENLGCLFLQFPNNFEFRFSRRLMQWIDSKVITQKLFLEFRHQSWFDNFKKDSKFLDFLRSKKIGIVITDVSGRRDVMHQYLTTDTVMIRFVATDHEIIDNKRLLDWSIKIKEWFDEGLSEVYFFMHSFDNNLVPKLTKILIEKMEGYDLKNKLQIPTFFGKEPNQLSLF